MLELFLLATVEKADVRTVYDLPRQVGLSWGAIRPSLVRLQKWGLLDREDAGARGRREFRLSLAGAETLGRWRELLEPAVPETDLGNVIRATWVAGLFDLRFAVEFVALAAGRRLGAVLKEEKANSDSLPNSPADAYRWMRQHTRAKQLQAEAEILGDLRDSLQRKCEENTPGAR
jgi:DNA-binding PadR family transcriptional regulator